MKNEKDDKSDKSRSNKGKGVTEKLTASSSTQYRFESLNRPLHHICSSGSQPCHWAGLGSCLWQWLHCPKHPVPHKPKTLDQDDEGVLISEIMWFWGLTSLSAQHDEFFLPSVATGAELWAWMGDRELIR